jgi:hypothetical protein
MQLKIKNLTALKTEYEQIRSHRTFLTTVCDNQVYCNSSHAFLLSPSKHDAQDPTVTSVNAKHVMKLQTFLQPLYKTLWMLPFGLRLACILLWWFCTQICPRHSLTHEGNNGFIAHGTWYLIMSYTPKHNPYS